MIVVIVTDLKGVDLLPEATIKRLLIKHDVLMINVSDSNVRGKNMYVVDTQRYLPSFFSEDKKLEKIEKQKKKELFENCINKLKKNGIAMITVDDVEGLDLKIVELLGKHKAEKR